MSIAQSISLFLLAGLSEIGGGYFVWQWWRNGAITSFALVKPHEGLLDVMAPL